MADKIKPIKRSKELISLSREHHDGLLLCWKIKEGLAKSISLERIRAYVLFFFNQYLAGHFKDEEQFIFPLLSPDNVNIKTAEEHHKILREIITNFKDEGQITDASLMHFVEILDKHIRFEERVLFPLIELEANQASLQFAATQLVKNSERMVEWDDQFWITKK